MSIITGGQVMPGSAGPILNAGAPTVGTSEIVTLTVSGSPTGGTFRLAKDGIRTAAIAYDAASGTVRAALEALASIGTGSVTVSGSAGGPWTATGAGTFAKLDLSAITLVDNSLVGGTNSNIVVAVQTPGVDATARGAIKGALLIDTTNGALYINTGTTDVPVWSTIASAELASLLTNIPASDIPALAATTDITAVPGSFADVAAVRTYLAGTGVVPNIEARLDSLEAKLNTVIAMLDTVGITA